MMAIKIAKNREDRPLSKIRPEDYDRLRESGRINGKVLAAMRDAVRPGIKTIELDAIAKEIHQQEGAEPPFLHYTFPGGKVPYPATINVSVNEELVHGIPGKRKLNRGDVVTLDCGTSFEGLITDSALTVIVGDEGQERHHDLIRATEEALDIAIKLVKPGRRIGDIAFAIQAVLQKYRVSIPPQFGGHGVGYSLHDDPHVPNMGLPNKGAVLEVGMAMAIEPMAMLGRPETRLLKDAWTVISADRSVCAHTEHSILILEDGAEILTGLPPLEA